MKSSFSNDESNVTKSAIAYALCNIITNALAIVTAPVFTRMMSTEEYGIISIYNGWKGLLLILFTLNLFYAVYNNAILKYKEKIYEYTSSMFGLIILIASVWMIFFFIFKDKIVYLSKLDSEYYYIMFVEILTLPGYYFWLAKERFAYKYKSVVVVTIVITCLNPIFGILGIYFLDNNAMGRIVGSAIPSIAFGTVITLIFIFRGKKLINREYWKYALRFNLPLIPHYISGIILSQSDRIMINNMVSSEKAGIYSVGYTLVFGFAVISSAINNAMVPWLYRCLKERKNVYIRIITTRILCIFALFLVLMNLVIPELMEIMAPKEYQEVVPVLSILVASVFFQFEYGLFGTVEFFYEESQGAAFASALAAGSNVVLNYCLIPVFGYKVAAYTTFISFLFMTVFHYIFMNRVLLKYEETVVPYNITADVVISIFEILLCQMGTLLYPHMIIRYVILLAAIIVAVLERRKIIGMLNVFR